MTTNCEELQGTLQSRAQTLKSDLESQMKALQSEISEKAKGIAPDINTTGLDVWIGLDFDVRWELVEISLHLPDVTIKDMEMFLDLPQFKMSNKEIIFHTPSVRMETQKVGEYPEFYCDTSTFIPKCTVRWSPIYADVPVPFMEEQRIVLGVPEIWMDTVRIVMGVPEFSMRRQDIKLHLPQFTLKDINVEAKLAKERGDALKAETQSRTSSIMGQFKENAKVELGGRITDVFDCFRDKLMSSKNEALATFDGQMTGIQTTIRSLVSAKVPNDNETMVRMNGMLAQVTKQRDDFIVMINQKLAAIDASQKKAVDDLLSSF